MGLPFKHQVHASMKSDSYDIETIVSLDNLLISKCTCKVGGGGNERIVCVHSLVSLYLLTILLTGGHLADHTIIELVNRRDDKWDSLMDKDKLTELKIEIIRLSVATWIYSTTTIDITGVSIIQMLKQYSVGTQRPKRLKSYFSDQKLMCPIRLLPTVTIKYIRKRGIATDMVGVFPLHKRAKIRDRMINNSAILRDSIGAATIIKYIP